MVEAANIEARNSTAAVVDLFCGAGGLSYGMKRAGLNIVAGIDIDPACRHPFETNVGSDFHEMDAAQITSGWITSLYSGYSTRVLAGCAPCQPFSSYSRRRVDENVSWGLLSKFSSLIDEVRPEVVTMENVPRLMAHPRFQDFLDVLESAEYKRCYGVVNCSDYGVPQRRRRLVLLASRLGAIQLIPASKKQDDRSTVEGAIGHLPEINAGGVCESDPLHRSSGLSERNLKRIRQSVPGGTWRDWDDDLRASCHSRDTGRTYPSVYGRMQWEELAPTITTQFHGFGNGRFGHPVQDRAISLREGAILQTFPQSYSFVPPGAPVHISPIARMIGNAVPVRLGEAIGKSILAHLEDVS